MDSSLSWPAGRQASQPGRVAAIRLEGELSESDAEGEISEEVVRWVVTWRGVMEQVGGRE